MFKEKLEKIVDDSFGMFLQDKDNFIYKNLRDEVVNNTASIIADEVDGLEKDESKGNGADCDCYAYGECDCRCDVDWTDYSVYNQALKEVKTKLGIEKGEE